MKRVRTSGWGAGLRLLALVLALTVRIVVPPGYMPSAGTGFTLAICTGQGLVTVQVKDAPPGDGAAAHHGGGRVCAFADDGPCPPVALIAGVTPPPADYGMHAAGRTPADLLPGRGLAAPPPPSQGPPVFLA